jgi:hypothetical protein
MLGHELVELFLVLGVTQAIEEIAEFGLLDGGPNGKPRRSMWLRIRSILYCIRSILFDQRS